MKFLNKDTKTVIETSDKRRIAKFKGYPDKFEKGKETGKTEDKKGKETGKTEE